jgi:hypothetical protein
MQLDVLNLFNTRTSEIEYYYLSRLPRESIGGVADRHVHPAEPLAVRLAVAAQFLASQRNAPKTNKVSLP